MTGTVTANVEKGTGTILCFTPLYDGTITIAGQVGEYVAESDKAFLVYNATTSEEVFREIGRAHV